jgi:Kef-type K+ transport system membrane component KefB
VSHVSFGGLAIVAAVGFGVPLLLGLLPRLKLPSVVLEIFVGIVVGPSVLGWVEVDTPIQVLSLLGLASLLFLAGLEIEVDRLGGRALQLAVIGFVISLALALGVAYTLQAFGLVRTPLFVAIVLAATGLGVIIPILKDSGEISNQFGQVVVAAASISDFGTVILLSLFFSRETSSTATQLFLLGGFLVLAAMFVMVGVRGGRWNRLSDVLVRLQDTTAQIRVRGGALLLVSMVAVAERFGLETILGAFIAGVILTLLDREAALTHPQFRVKLEAIGFGLFVPIFFVTSGIKFNLGALLASPSSMLQVPVYLLALLVVRGLPAWLYLPLLGTRRSIAAGLFQATSLSFIVASVQIGMELRVLTEATGAALVASALLSVLIFPLSAGLVLRGAPAESD